MGAGLGFFSFQVERNMDCNWSLRGWAVIDLFDAYYGWKRENETKLYSDTSQNGLFVFTWSGESFFFQAAVFRCDVM